MGVLTNFIQVGDYSDDVGVTFTCTNPVYDICEMGEATRPIFGLLWDVPDNSGWTVYVIAHR